MLADSYPGGRSHPAWEGCRLCSVLAIGAVLVDQRHPQLVGWARQGRGRNFLLYHGVFATVVGLVLLLMGWFEMGGSPLISWLLGIGFLVAGVLNIGVYAGKGEGRQAGQLINALISFALGGIIVAGQIWQIPVLAWLSWLLIAVGAVLLVVGFVVRARGKSAQAAQPAEPAPAPASEPGASATGKPGPAELATPTEPTAMSDASPAEDNPSTDASPR